MNNLEGTPEVKKLALIATIAALATPAFAVDLSAQCDESKPTDACLVDQSPVDPLVVNMVHEYSERYNARDAKGMTTHFTPDAVYVTPDGVAHHGRDEIQQTFTKLFSKDSPKINGIPDESYQLDATHIVGIGHATRLYDDKHTSNASFMAVYKKEGNSLLVQFLKISVAPKVS